MEVYVFVTGAGRAVRHAFFPTVQVGGLYWRFCDRSWEGCPPRIPPNCTGRWTLLEVCVFVTGVGMAVHHAFLPTVQVGGL